MAHVSPYGQIDDARPKDDKNGETSVRQASDPKWPLTVFALTAVLTLVAMVAVLFSPFYPSPKVGVGLAFVIAIGFFVLYVTARKAAIIRGRH